MKRQLIGDLVLQIVAFGVLVASVSLLWRDNLLLFGVALVQGALALARWHERHDLCILFVIGGVGSLAEVVFVWFGVWQYANPTLLGLPLWFPLSFGTAGLLGGRLARTLAALWDELAPPTRSAGVSPACGPEARAPRPEARER